MCWSTKLLSHTQAKVAENDIKVFKVAMINEDGDVESYYTHFIYKNGIVYTNGLSNFTPDRYCSYLGEITYQLNAGYHSYSLENKINNIKNSSGRLGLLEISNCDSYNYKNYYPCDNDDGDCYLNSVFALCIALCTIPKGSIYFVNENGEYVSDSIRIDEHFVAELSLIERLGETTIEKYIEEYKKEF